jgi:hypothetical protein
MGIVEYLANLRIIKSQVGFKNLASSKRTVADFREEAYFIVKRLT